MTEHHRARQTARRHQEPAGGTLTMAGWARRGLASAETAAAA
jgi:hypothetical protein